MRQVGPRASQASSSGVSQALCSHQEPSSAVESHPDEEASYHLNHAKDSAFCDAMDAALW